VTSRQILWRELVTLYNAHVSGTPHRLDPPGLQYYDYAVWQKEFMESENYKRQRAYWLTQLSDPPPLLDLPTDYPRKENARLKISFLHMDLNPQLAANLRTFSLRSRVLFSATFLSAFYILLNKYSGQKDILIGNIFRGRDPGKNKLNKIVGLFINCLAMRLDTTEIDANDDINVWELLDLVNKKTRETYNNQDFLFEDLIRTIQPRYAKNTFPFQAVFNMIKAPPVGVEWQELTKKERQGVERDTTFTAQCDLSLYIRDELNNNNINIKIFYPEDLFKKETNKRMLTQYTHILMEIVEQPAKKLRHLQIITKEEKHRIMNHFNNTSKEYPPHKTIHGLFEEQAEQTPLHIALVAPEIEPMAESSDLPTRHINAHLTYKELNRRANQLARLLQAKGAKGVGPDTDTDTVVGIMATRSD
jgi:non-ribosomal peptide synthetase component F